MNKHLLNQILLIGLVMMGTCTAQAADESQLIAVLKSNAGAVEKCEACKQLRIVGTAKSVPVLAALLPDERVGHAARYAMEAMPYAQAGTALREAINSTSGPIRAGLIDSVGWRGDKAAVGILVPLLSNQDATIAQISAIALGRIGGKDAEAALSAACEKSKGETAIVVAEALIKCAERHLNAGEKATAEGLYRKAMASDASVAIRGAAWRGLALSNDEKQGALVIEALKGNDKALKRIAARLVQETKNQQLINTCMKQWNDLPADAQVLLISVISASGDRTSLKDIVKACSSSDQMVRIAAIKAIGVLGDAANVPFLVERAAKTSGSEQAATMESLGTLRDAKINQTLIEQLKRGDKASKAIVCQALLDRNAVEASPALIEAAKTSASVRDEALKALRSLAGKSDIPALVDLIFVVKPSEADKVVKVLSSVARRHSARQECTKTILSKYRTASNDSQRAALLITLGSLGDEAALPVLRSALKDKSKDLQDAAVRGLSQWPAAGPKGEPMDDLLGIARTSSNRVHKVLALRAYIDLIPTASSLSDPQKIEACKTAMKLADNQGEKKRALGAVSAIHNIEAFNMACSYLKVEALKAEAAVAATTIGEAIYGQNPKPVKAAMEEVVDMGAPSFVLDKARKIIDQIEATTGFLTDWQVAGPYFQEGKNHAQLFDIPFEPETAPDKVKWSLMPVSTTETGQPGYLDLLKQLNGGEQRVAYLRTTIESPIQGPAKLQIFSDDGVKAWLNGQVVHSNNIARPIVPEPDQVAVTLKIGTNTLMLKVTQNNLPWGAIVKLHDVRVPRPKLGAGFKLHTINADSKFEAAGAFDVNKDGKIDIFCGGFWYESPNWKQHFVREIQYDGNYYYDFASLPMDVDGDGWIDIGSAAWHNKMVYWVRNPGDSGKPWEVFEIDTPGNMETAIAVDIDGDGQEDILPNIMDKAAWYSYKPDSASPGGAKWTKHPLPQQASGHGNGAGDVNNDGRCDVVASGGWAEQLPGEKWQWHAEFNLGTASVPVLVHDVDGDKDSDIIWGMGHGYGIFWLEQSKDAAGKRTWQKHAIDDSWSQPHFLILTDLNNDKTIDLITGKRVHAHNGHDPGGNEPPCVYYYTYNKSSKKWTRHLLHEAGRVGLGINTQAIDMDKDGDIDLVAPGKSGLYLFENLIVK